MRRRRKRKEEEGRIRSGRDELEREGRGEELEDRKKEKGNSALD
jgi:hypothetical protein